ncbi:MAG TPA: DivIVA domain-containing protein [Solirubrobacteraceae bacterium]|nr:DivIVA domain-containing protein [Solirubrobacteraceae bacterium]
MDLDRQAIERRDFPVSRRGYDPASVDAHLRGLASEFEELQRSAGGGETSLASAAGTQVQSILEATETAAAEIERQALEHAGSVREAADQDAERTREQAVERARAHVAAVEQATAALLTRVQSLDGETGKLIESLRTGAGRLAGDLGALERSMGELYDAASGRTAPTAAGSPPAAGEASASRVRVPEPAAQPQPSAQAPEQQLAEQPAAPASAPLPAPESPPQSAAPGGGDLDGARLIALNMALNGQSREDAERYLAAHFQSIDRLKLIDEVYAAIEG